MSDLFERWQALDERIRTWWDLDLRTATSAEVAVDPAGTLIELPHPYSTAGGAEHSFPEMYGWDTHFVNLGMLAHDRSELVADHLRNLCFMVERYGMVLNGNRTYYLTRSQPPMMADSLMRYHHVARDPALLRRATAAIAAEYHGYWGAEHHRTGDGLSTNRDSGDPGLRPELAAEAETGLDFTPLFGGDPRRCVPLITNCALVRTAEVLGQLAGTAWQRRAWGAERERRSSALRRACWDEQRQFYLEWDRVAATRLPVRSLAAYLTLWAGVATEAQAAALVAALDDFEGPGGLAFTDRPHPSPHPQWRDLQWQFPTAWPPAQVWVVQGLLRYGYAERAQQVARTFVANQVSTWEMTGSLWEKYDSRGSGVAALPLERYPSVPMHGWSSASVAVLGRVAFGPAEPDRVASHSPSGSRPRRQL